ncbi:glycine betaine ABC transporter substrate-binding protein [Oscillibacter valericigenes]|nr:glycine betaine ABC transporter substrate-binding protein [Oscillibacter valericigenes]
MTWDLILQHLFIVLASALASIVVGLPLGVLAYLYPKARTAILWVADLLQTIPSLALLGIIMVVAGPGKLTVIIGITLYSLLPIVRNTCLGLQEVDPGVKEAARGMGMGRTYRLLHVEFPLAFPMVFTGVRIAVVNAIGSAVFAAFVGGGGLGSVINRGIRIADMGMILSATGALMVIAVLLDLGMGWFEGHLKKSHGVSRRSGIILACIMAAVAISIPFGLRDTTGESELVLYDGDYSETQIMDRIIQQLVESKTDLTVTIKDQMSQVNNYNALKGDGHSCDMMISYDGTLLTTFLKKDPTDVPAGESLYDFTNALSMEQNDMRLLEKLGFNNTYAIAVPQEIAEQYGLEKVSDLIPVADQLTFGAEQEFFTLEGSMKYGPFTEFYGLNFKSAVPVDAGLKYTAIENRSFDVTEVYATDGLNRKVGLKILEDDLHFFPEYNGAFLIREDTLDKFADAAPELEDVLNLLAGKISNEDMTEMTYQVDVLGGSADDVAREFLQSLDLL